MPSLPVLKTIYVASNNDLVRFFHKLELERSRALGEETVLDSGVAITNSKLANVHEANRILDASILHGLTTEATVAEAQRHFVSAGSVCHQWVINPSATAEQAIPLVDCLMNHGYVKTAYDILHLPQLPQNEIIEPAGLHIIPARAGFRQLRALMDEITAIEHLPNISETIMLQLDDPQVDALLALKDGVAVGFIAVLIVGELAGIQSLFVSESHRRQGVGRTLMSRALEICVRSLSRNILLGIEPANQAGRGLCNGLGFRKIGEFAMYTAAGQ